MLAVPADKTAERRTAALPVQRTTKLANLAAKTTRLEGATCE